MSEHLTPAEQIKLKQFIQGFTEISPEKGHGQGDQRSKVCYKLVLERGVLKHIFELTKQYSLLSFIEVINNNLSKGLLPIRSNVTRVEERLIKLGYETCHKFQKLKGRKKNDFLFEKITMTIFNDEVLSVVEIAQNETIRLQKEFREQITKLHHDIAQLQNNINHISKQSNEQILVIQEQNHVLVNYIEKMRMQYPNTGKKLSELNRKSASKKLSILKNRVEKALWFAKSFGVTFEDITCTDNSGKKYYLLDNNKSRFDNLPEVEKDKVKNILFILDQFCISDEAYHELTVQNNTMVKSYLIKQCRENLNNIFSIKQTPGLHPGAQLDLFETLDRLLINLNLPNDGRNIPRAQIKLAADEAKVSRISSFLVLSLCILNNGDEVMSSSGQHTLAIVSSDEK